MKTLSASRRVLIRNDPKPPGPLTLSDILLLTLVVGVVAVVAWWFAVEVSYATDDSVPVLPAVKHQPTAVIHQNDVAKPDMPYFDFATARNCEHPIRGIARRRTVCRVDTNTSEVRKHPIRGVARSRPETF